MYRPCFLVIDQEFPGSISTRKLVLETAKYNVITAYSSSEAIDVAKRFPNIDGAVLDAAGHEHQCADLVVKLRAAAPQLKVVITSGKHDVDCGDPDLHLESYDPRKLLDALAKLFPEDNARLTAHEDEISHQLKVVEKKKTP